MAENLYKKKGKVLWFVLGLIIPLLFVLLSVIGFFEWRCPGEICISLYIPNESIFLLLIDNYSVLVLIVFLIYVYQFVFSFIYWIKDIKMGKLIQIMNIGVSIFFFVITFIIAYNIAIEKNFILFFM